MRCGDTFTGSKGGCDSNEGIVLGRSGSQEQWTTEGNNVPHEGWLASEVRGSRAAAEEGKLFPEIPQGQEEREEQGQAQPVFLSGI